MRRFLAPAFCVFCLFASIPADPQRTPPALNRLCAVDFDSDGTFSSESAACLNLLASTLKVSTGLQLVLTGSAAHVAAVENYLTGHESIPASDLRTETSESNPQRVLTALVKPLPRAERMPVIPTVMSMEPLVLGSRPPESALPGRVAPPRAADPYPLGEQELAWKTSLKNGAIEYNVPPVMIAQRASTVTVIVHGYMDPNPHLLKPGAGTASATQKVSDTMQVDLIGSPTEFTITPQATPAVQFVPTDGYSTWVWSVVPAGKASAQQLTIKVSLIPDAKSGLPPQPLQSTPYFVNVNVESLWSVLGDRWHQDPMKAIEYILPGGAGWAALGTLLTTLGVGTWLRNKLNKNPTPNPAANQNPTPAV